MNEKGIRSIGHSASALGAEQLTALLKAADLLVNPVHRNDLHHFGYELAEDEIQAVLLYLDGH